MELGNASPHPHALPTTRAVGFSQQELYKHAMLAHNWNRLRQIKSEALCAFGVLFAVGPRRVLQTAMSQDKQEVAMCLATPAWNLWTPSGSQLLLTELT